MFPRNLPHLTCVELGETTKETVGSNSQATKYSPSRLRKSGSWCAHEEKVKLTAFRSACLMSVIEIVLKSTTHHATKQWMSIYASSE